MYDYSSSNASIDLPALPCPACKQAQQDAINLPYHQTEFYFGKHDPFEANYDQIEYELDDPDHPTISIQDEPWTDPASPVPTSDHDIPTCQTCNTNSHHYLLFIIINYCCCLCPMATGAAHA